MIGFAACNENEREVEVTRIYSKYADTEECKRYKRKSTEEAEKV